LEVGAVVFPKAMVEKFSMSVSARVIFSKGKLTQRTVVARARNEGESSERMVPSNGNTKTNMEFRRERLSCLSPSFIGT
jgi:hypothetical protein